MTYFDQMVKVASENGLLVSEITDLVEAPLPEHTTRGKTAAEGAVFDYGVQHDYDCPACLASGSSYLTSPRSETYWAS